MADRLSGEFRRLVWIVAYELLANIGDDINCGNTLIENYIQHTEQLIRLTKRSTRLKTLDRHKLLAVIAVSALLFQPLRMTGTTVSRDAYFANELFAYALCKRIMFYFLADQYDKKFTLNPAVIAQLEKAYKAPEKVRDQNGVDSCYIQALNRIRPSNPTPCTNAAADSEMIGKILLISHIYFYYESYNWNNWISIQKTGSDMPYEAAPPGDIAFLK